MAEAKVHDYQELEPKTEQPNLPSQTTPERPEIIVAPASPGRRLHRITRIEKWIGMGLLLAIIGLAVLTIHIRTDISQIEHDISSVQADTTAKGEERVQLEQEKSELSKTERIKKIAEEKGLKINDDNLRKVN